MSDKIMKAFLDSIDWDMLKTQKNWLIAQNACDESTGLINLIDAIQDIAVDRMGFDEKTVFTGTQNDA